MSNIKSCKKSYAWQREKAQAENQLYFPVTKTNSSASDVFIQAHMKFLRKQGVTVFPSPFTEMTGWKTLLWNTISPRPQQRLISVRCNTEVKVEPFDTTTEVCQWQKTEILNLLKTDGQFSLIGLSKQVYLRFNKEPESVEKVHGQAIGYL